MLVTVVGLNLHLIGLSAGNAIRSRVIGWTMLVFGFVLYWWADQRGEQVKTAQDWAAARGR